MFGALGSAIDSANSLLGNNPAPASAPTDVEAKFTQSDPIEVTDPNDSGRPAAPNNSGTAPNMVNHSRQTEFIHFGYVHLDRSEKFPHPATNPASLDPPTGHAILFRDAVEREAILINGFISNIKAALDEASSGEGVAAQALGAVSSLTGGGGSPAPDTSALDAFLKKVTAAGGSVLPVVITYPPVHKAAVDLHQARVNYQDFVTKRNAAAKPASGGGSGPGALIPVPAVGGAVDFVQKILFKPMDVFLAMMLTSLAKYENPLIEACHSMTMKSIREQQPRTFSIWYPIPEKTQATPPDPNDPKFIQDIKKTVADAEKTVSDDKKKLQDFLDITDPIKSPGDEFFDQAFSAFLTADLQLAGLKKGLGIDNLPGPLVTVLTELANSCGNILKVAYQQMMRQSAIQGLGKDFLLAASDEFIGDKLISLLVSLVPLLDPKNSVDIGGIGAVGANTLDKKGADLIAQRLGPEMNLVLQYAIGTLGDQLTAVQIAALTNQSNTMEFYFGALPRIYCLFVRNLFFPLFDTIIDKVFGMGNSALASGLSPIKSMLQTGKQIAGTVEDVKNRADRAAQMLSSPDGVNQGNVGQFANSVFGKNAPTAAAAQGSSGAGFPGTPRQASGSAVKIPKADLDAVEPNFKYDQAQPA